MEFTLDTLRDRIGLEPADTSKDVELTFSMELVISLMERYLDRRLLIADEVEKFTHVIANKISLIRYPIHSITSINGIKHLGYHFGEETGIVHFDGAVLEHEVTVEYNGGYTVLPNDLVYAALLIFDATWGAIEGGATVAAGAISKVVLQDVGSVTYNTGGTTGAVAARPQIGQSSLVHRSRFSICWESLLPGRRPNHRMRQRMSWSDLNLQPGVMRN